MEEQTNYCNSFRGVSTGFDPCPKAFGVEIPVDEEIANTIAAGVLCLVNIVLTLVTTDKIGLPSKPNEVSVQPEDRVELQSESEPEVSTTPAPISNEPKSTDFTDYRN